MAALCFAIFVPFAVVGAFLHAKFLKQLRIHYPEIWMSLGSPRFGNTSLQSSFSILRFLLKGEFRDVDNQEFIKLGERLRTFTIVYIWSLAFAVGISLIWTIYVGSRPS
jgi:hypothetical protein